jgi:DNA-binding NarL/FixJ family response regulator
VSDIRVLVVDDHPVFRDGLVGLLDSLPEVVCVGAVGDATAALTFLDRNSEVDVVLMDLNLPGMSGTEATREIAERTQAPRVLVVTMVDDDDMVVAAMRAGAAGYVLKGATGSEIAAAIHTVTTGGVVFGAGVARRVLEMVRIEPTGGQVPNGLTERERQVLELLASGSSNSVIARELGLSLKTVQNYVSRILDKMQVADRTQAALRARDSELGVHRD